MLLLNILLQAGAGPTSGSSYGSLLLLLIIIAIIITVVLKTYNKNNPSEKALPLSNDFTNVDQTNKVVNVTLNGGLIGLLSDSPQDSLNSRIKIENANGWKVIQVIPADSGNLFLAIFRLLLLLCTLFMYTTTNGYYVIMEKK